jgi:hypothetical protein
MSPRVTLRAVEKDRSSLWYKQQLKRMKDKEEVLPWRRYISLIVFIPALTCIYIYMKLLGELERDLLQRENIVHEMEVSRSHGATLLLHARCSHVSHVLVIVTLLCVCVDSVS